MKASPTVLVVDDEPQIRRFLDIGFRAQGYRVALAANAAEALAVLADVVEASDRTRALTLIRQGRDNAQRCDDIIRRVARSAHDAATATALVLAARYYKRIGGHVLNILSSVVMPLDSIAHFDEPAEPANE